MYLQSQYIKYCYQTTIEFYINYENRSAAKSLGILYRNPFDEGWRKNLTRVFGQHILYSIFVPCSNTPPEPLYPLQLTPGVLQSENFMV